MRLRLLLQASEALQVLALEGCGAERSGAKVHRRRRKTSRLTDGKEPTVPHGIQHEEPNDAEWPRAALLARDGRGTVIGAAAAVAASGVRRHKQTHKVYGHSQWAIGWAKPLQSAAWHFQCDSMYICCMYVWHAHTRTRTPTHPHTHLGNTFSYRQCLPWHGQASVITAPLEYSTAVVDRTVVPIVC